MKLTLRYVYGVAGNSVYLNDYRIAGPKPWGGGRVLASFQVDSADLKRAVPELFSVNS